MSNRWWPSAGVALGVLATLVVVADVRSPLRALVVLAFLTLGPGTALVPLIRLDDPLWTAVLTVFVSLTAACVVSGSLMYAGLWTPARSLVVLLVVTVLGAILQDRVGDEERTARS